ncbi:MAG: ABC transporter substrate-binding protein [Tabrizicola sp.]
MRLTVSRCLSEPGDRGPAGRRRLLTVFVTAPALLLAGLLPALAREITDAAGRSVTVPDAPARVFAAGPLAAVPLYALAPETMVGWVRAPCEGDLPWLVPATHALPELGRLTAKGGTVNLEVLLAQKPDLIVDFGTVNQTYIDLANKVTEQTGIPYVLIDGSFANTPAALRLLGEVLGRPERGEALAAHAERTFARVDADLAGIPADQRPRVYLARGAEGLESAAAGAINAEIIERAGAVNVATGETRGLITPSLEQVIAWAPGTIITIDRDFAGRVASLADWQAVPAVANGRVFLAPSTPFGFIDSPPSVNRLIGLIWMLHVLYPEQAGGDLPAAVTEFARLFWQVEPDAAMLDRVVGP